MLSIWAQIGPETTAGPESLGCLIALGVYLDLLGSIGIHCDQLGSIGIHWDPWGSMGINGDIWSSIYFPLDQFRLI